MLRLISLFLFVLFLMPPLQAQEWVWGRGSMGSNVSAWAVAADTSGNAFVAGVQDGTVSFDRFYPSYTAGGHQCVLAKYDGAGNFLWSRATQSGANAGLINITADREGNCYLLGWLHDTAMSIGTARVRNSVYPNAQYFVAKYDAEGNVAWAATGGGRSGTCTIAPVTLAGIYTSNLQSMGAIAADTNGNIYVSCGFNLPVAAAGSYTLHNTDAGGSTGDVMLVKYDAAGNVQWATSCGGKGEDIPSSMTVTHGGEIFIAGIFNSDSLVLGSSAITDTSTGPQRWNGYIAKFSPAGNAMYGAGSCGGGEAYADGVAADEYGNVYLTGGFAGTSISFGGTAIVNRWPGQPVQYLVKLNGALQPMWHKVMGSPAGGSWGYGVAVAGGMVWTCGAFTDKVDIDGHMLDTPAVSADPLFITCFTEDGAYIASDALQSGARKQMGIASASPGTAYIGADYTHPCRPFVIAGDLLADVPVKQNWLYLAKYSFHGGGPASGFSVYSDTVHLSLCTNDSLLVIAPQGFTVYRWNDRTENTLRYIKEAGTYSVTCIGGAEHSRLTRTYQVSSNPELCDCQAFLPTAFTPGPSGSRENNTYGPIFKNGCYISKYAFSIYNRWGELVFHTEDPYAKWDGTYKGKDAEVDVYMFYLVYTPDPKYPQQVKKGDVTLVR